ncbi:hypothetical protein ACJJIK_03930 [Microbulbifer sp. ZKSA006]|uniref:hypothetical protein n=1 Tax=Microbulbifer sp. ZKSA006 TaxID=3243390 RepID=UPI00403A4FCD
MPDVNSLDLSYPIIEQVDNIYWRPFCYSRKYRYNLGDWHLSFYGESRAQPGENSLYASYFTPIHSEESYSKFNDEGAQWSAESPYIWFKFEPLAAVCSLEEEWNDTWTLGTIALDVRVIQIREPNKSGVLDISDHSQLKLFIFKQHSDKRDLLLNTGYKGYFSATSLNEIQEHEINGRSWYEIVDGNRNLNCCFNLYTPLSDKHLLHVAYIVNQFWPPHHMPSEKALQVSKHPLWDFMEDLTLSRIGEDSHTIKEESDDIYSIDEYITKQRRMVRAEEEWSEGVDSVDSLDLNFPIILQLGDIHWPPFDREPVHYYDLGGWSLSFSGKRSLQVQEGVSYASYTTPIQEDKSYPKFDGVESYWGSEDSYIWFKLHPIMARCSAEFGADCTFIVGTVFFDIQVIQLRDPAMFNVYNLPNNDPFKHFILDALIPHSKGVDIHSFNIDGRTWYKIGHEECGNTYLYTCLSTKHFLNITYRDDQFYIDGWNNRHTNKSKKVARSPIWDFMKNLKLSKVEEGSQVITGTIEREITNSWKENAECPNAADRQDLSRPIIEQVDDIYWMPFNRAPQHYYDLGSWRLSYSGAPSRKTERNSMDDRLREKILDWGELHSVSVDLYVELASNHVLKAGAASFCIDVAQPRGYKNLDLLDDSQFKNYLFDWLGGWGDSRDILQKHSIKGKVWYGIYSGDNGCSELFTSLSDKHFLHITYKGEQFTPPGYNPDASEKALKLRKSPLWDFIDNLELCKIEEGSQVITGTVGHEGANTGVGALEELSSYTKMKAEGKVIAGTIEKERDPVELTRSWDETDGSDWTEADGSGW